MNACSVYWKAKGPSVSVTLNNWTHPSGAATAKSRRAMKLLRRGLETCGIGEEELVKLKKNDARKVAIAAVIRRRTSVPNEWIAGALELGYVRRVSRCWAQENALTAQLEKAL